VVEGELGMLVGAPTTIAKRAARTPGGCYTHPEEAVEFVKIWRGLAGGHIRNSHGAYKFKGRQH
jgi:fructose/tagatose bisphosphate aldolase